MMEQTENVKAKPPRRRTGCIYSEIQRNMWRGSGELHSETFRRGVGHIETSRLRWVAEIYYHGVRYRFRSTNYGNVRFWLDIMVLKLN